MSLREQSKVHAGETTYELHSLGWKAFQDLCVTLTGEVWGQTVQCFFDSHDGGRDGAFHGTWRTIANEVFDGTFTAQCKFTAKANNILKLGDLKDELTKAERLAAKGLSDNYFLFTNARLTGTNDEKIRKAFEAVPGIKHFAAYGCERISQIIRESSRLRILVPRVYGLGDLSQILDERAYAQAFEILSSMGGDLAKFVITDAYRKSAKALVEHGFVLLLGEPACGKSTIAAALAVGALDEWGCSTVKVRDADEFIKHSNPHEPKQFFWIDDAFGATQFDWSSVAAWNHAFPHIHAAIRRGAKVLFTSRDYIYRSARKHLKESALPVLKESQVVIQVENLSKSERDQILYNHIRLGNQSKEFKTQLKLHLPVVAEHQRFSPEIARRLGNPVFTKELTVSKNALDEFVERPLELLCEVIRTLDVESRSAIALVFMNVGRLVCPVELSASEKKAIELLGGSINGFRGALTSLNESLLLLSFQDGSHVWQFKHPTVRDAFALLIAEDLELMDIYLTGTPIEKLFDEISCGDVGVEGVKVIVPVGRYESLMARIDTLKSQNQRNLHRFLAHRCDQELMTGFIDRHPSFIQSLRVGGYLYAVSDVEVILRLKEFGLLPESKRLESVGIIREIAVDIPDADFLRDKYRVLFTAEEFANARNHVLTSLLPNLDDHIDNWARDFDCENDPESYFYDLKSTLGDYRIEFSGNATAVTQIDNALAAIDQTIEDLMAEMPQDPDMEEYYGGRSGGSGGDCERSVFDDVDF